MKLTKKLFFILLIAVMAVVVAYFYKINDSEIDLDFIFYKLEKITIGSMVVLSFLAGIIFTVALTFVEIVIAGRKDIRIKKENKKLKKEIAKLKEQYEKTSDKVLTESIEDKNGTVKEEG